MLTKNIIIQMLKENTVTHFLDSGDYYGRHWQRNKNRDFPNEPICDIEVFPQTNEILISYNIYHFLNNFLERDSNCVKWEKLFYRFASRPENEDRSWFDLIDEFIETNSFTLHGRHNTYNDETILSQNFQYYSFSPDGDEYNMYIFLQIHGGCDARGGYTKPRIFRVTDRDSFYSAMSYCDAYCVNCHHNWYSDDCGYHWHIGAGGKIPKSQDGLVKCDFSDIKIKDKTPICPVCGHAIKFSVMVE